MRHTKNVLGLLYLNFANWHRFFPTLLAEQTNPDDSLPPNRRGLREESMDREQEHNLRDELVALQQRHRSLDEEIVELELSASVDQLTIKRLKKEKLALKDRIYAIEDQLTPDIIA